MKKLYFLLMFSLGYAISFGQALLTIVQTSPNSGIYTITYNDSANGWTFYNPYSQPIGIYM